MTNKESKNKLGTNKPVLYCADARNLLDYVSPKSVDAVITSPPYFDAKDYGGVLNQIGHGQTYEDYMQDLESNLKQCYKVTKNTGCLWLIMDTIVRNGTLKMIPFELAQRLEEAKESWKLTDIIIWDKGKSLPWTKKGQFRGVSEYILFFTKSSDFKFSVDRIREPDLTKWWVKFPERYNPLGKIPGDIWTFRIPTQGSWGNGYINHFCPFPWQLVERIVLLTTDPGDVVLDPFAGSGSVLATASLLNRKAIGIELNPEYIKRFEDETYPNFKKEHSHATSLGFNSRGKRERLFKKVATLTQLKYAMTLAHDMIEKNDTIDENTSLICFIDIHLDIDAFESNSQLKPEIVFIEYEKGTSGLLNKSIEITKSESEISTYRVDPHIRVMSLSGFKRSKYFQKLRDKVLFLYRGSKFYDYSEEVRPTAINRILHQSRSDQAESSRIHYLIADIGAKPDKEISNVVLHEKFVRAKL